MSVDEMLESARRRLARVEPHDVPPAITAGALLIDIRADFQRRRDGGAPGALFIPRNVLEWRCDPASPWRDPAASDPDRQVIVLCDEGYQSSLAAVALQDLGLVRATDVVGGFQAWRAAGLPVEPPPAQDEVSMAYAPAVMRGAAIS